MKVKKFLILVIAGIYFSIINTYAEDNPLVVKIENGIVAEYDKNSKYVYGEELNVYDATENNTYGKLFINGDVNVIKEKKEQLPSFSVNKNNVTFKYVFDDKYLNKSEDQWHLVEDKTDIIDNQSLDNKIMNGTINVWLSSDSEKWGNDVNMYNYLSDISNSEKNIYETNDIQLLNGCFYSIDVVYMLGRKTGEHKIGFIKVDDYEYKRYKETYFLYLEYTNIEEKAYESNEQFRLGSWTKVDENYYGEKELSIDDVHYGWDLGDFYIKGYTRQTEDENGLVFLKKVGDKISLTFELLQDIDSLNNNTNLRINEDKNCTDMFFGVPVQNFGRGTLLLAHIDSQNKIKPIIYTNFLAASAKVGTNTKIQLFEEGDYFIALDYEIQNTDTFFNDTSNYQIFANFKIRNGNCMVYPFDEKTQNELQDKSITPNGFHLDFARSKYLEINVKRIEIIKQDNNYTLDVRFNGPARDGEKYTDEGMYVFSVKNKYTDEKITKTIFVGDNELYQVLSKSGYSTDEINQRLNAGWIIENGTFYNPQNNK